jgi:hypothetical protein
MGGRRNVKTFELEHLNGRICEEQLGREWDLEYGGCMGVDQERLFHKSCRPAYLHEIVNE